MLNKKISKDSTKTLFYRDYKKFKENKLSRDFLDDAEKGQLQKYDKNEERKHENLDNKQSWKYEKREIKLCMITWMIK